MSCPYSNPRITFPQCRNPANGVPSDCRVNVDASAWNERNSPKWRFWEADEVVRMEAVAREENPSSFSILSTCSAESTDIPSKMARRIYEI